MFEDVTVGRFAVYSLWFQLISWHLAQALQTSMFETVQNKLKWPPRFLWCTTSQQSTDNAVIYSKPILESQRRFGCPEPAISLTGITFLQLKDLVIFMSSCYLCKAWLLHFNTGLMTCSGIMYAVSSSAALLVSHTSRHSTTQACVDIQVLCWLQRLWGSTVTSPAINMQGCSAYRSGTWKQLQQLRTWCPPTPLEERKYLLQPFKVSSHLKLTALTRYNYFCGPSYQFPIKHKTCPFQ